MWLKIFINMHLMVYHINKQYSLTHGNGTYKKMFMIRGRCGEPHRSTSTNLYYSAEITYFRKNTQSIGLALWRVRKRETRRIQRRAMLFPLTHSVAVVWLAKTGPSFASSSGHGCETGNCNSGHCPPRSWIEIKRRFGVTWCLRICTRWWMFAYFQTDFFIRSSRLNTRGI